MKYGFKCVFRSMPPITMLIYIDLVRYNQYITQYILKYRECYSYDYSVSVWWGIIQLISYKAAKLVYFHLNFKIFWLDLFIYANLCLYSNIKYMLTYTHTCLYLECSSHVRTYQTVTLINRNLIFLTFVCILHVKL